MSSKNNRGTTPHVMLKRSFLSFNILTMMRLEAAISILSSSPTFRSIELHPIQKIKFRKRKLLSQSINAESINQQLNLGIQHFQSGQFLEAEACFQKVLQLQSENPDAWHLLGVIAAQRKQYKEAIERIERAIEIKPTEATFHGNLGNALQEQGRLEEAMKSYQRVLQLKPDSHQAHNNLGNALKEQGKLEEAMKSYQRALQLKPDFHQAHNNLGTALQEQGKLEEAMKSYQRALQLKPDSQISLSQYVWTRRMICHWDDLTTFEQSLITVAQSEQSAPSQISPFLFLAVTDDPSVQLEAAHNYCRKNAESTLPPLWKGERYIHDKIRLAYLSADYQQHATANLMAELFEQHDRSRFELFALSFGREDTSPMRKRLIKAFDHFIDVRQMSHLEAAQQIRNLEIDIAVDLKGYTKDCRPQILAHRPAPIQVNYLGYPGTMGVDFIDYILVDSFVVPPEQQPYFTEKLVHLPDCYQVNVSKHAIADRTPSRQECGLPAQGFIFCSFNNSYKIAPTFFDIWMRLLKVVPGSVLWLLSHNQWMEENLRREAQSRRVTPDRLLFAPKQKLPEHLARHRLADLFLDNLPYNAHTTASDALWAGLPVLTCAGQSFAARVAGSLLHAIGLPELVTYNVEDYEALALKLATEPEFLQQINEKLQRNRLNTPLFDTDRFRQNIEAAYTKMWSLWHKGKTPRAFTINSLHT